MLKKLLATRYFTKLIQTRTETILLAHDINENRQQKSQTWT